MEVVNIVYSEYKVYGPYFRKDGRQHVCLKHKEDGSRKTVSWPKFLYENTMGYRLENGMTIDHIDRNFNNNSIDNLQVIAQSEHTKLDHVYVKEISFICECCGNAFTLQDSKVNDAFQNRKKGKRGPFCSRSCAGVASQNIEAYSIKEVIKDHFYKTK